MNKRRVVGFGSVTWDFCALIDQEPQYERVVRAHRFLEAPGGQMGNTLRFLSRFGLQCFIKGHIGSDVYGDKIISSLVQDGVNVDGLIRHQNSSLVSLLHLQMQFPELEASFIVRIHLRGSLIQCKASVVAMSFFSVSAMTKC